MKRFGIILLVLVLILALAACRKNDPQDSTPTGTQPTVSSDPTIGTNIPDPTVNGNSTMPDMTEDPTDGSIPDNTDGTDDFGGATDGSNGMGSGDEGIDPSVEGGTAGDNARSRVLRRFNKVF